MTKQKLWGFIDDMRTNACISVACAILGISCTETVKGVAILCMSLSGVMAAITLVQCQLMLNKLPKPEEQ